MNDDRGDQVLGSRTNQVRQRSFERASWVNVLGNTAKILVEGIIGLAFGSMALLADAAHSVADLVASIVVLVWGRGTYDDPDATHPHGHERIEPFAALFVGAVIVVLGLQLLYESIQGILTVSDVQFSYFLLGAIAFAIIDMYLVYRYTEHVNETVNSTALAALATDCLNDIFTSIAALVGVIGILLGFSIMDSVAGGLVSILVVYQGVRIGRENVDYLLGAAPPPGKRSEIISTLRSHPAVRGIHDLAVYYEGTAVEVEVHVEVDGEMSLHEAHALETHLGDLVRSLDDVGDVHVHLDPSGIGEWKDAPE